MRKYPRREDVQGRASSSLMYSRTSNRETIFFMHKCFTRIHEDVGMTQNENQLSRNERPWFAPLSLRPLKWWSSSSSLCITLFCKCRTMHNATLHQHEQTRWQAFLLRMRISIASVPEEIISTRFNFLFVSILEFKTVQTSKQDLTWLWNFSSCVYACYGCFDELIASVVGLAWSWVETFH